MHQFNAGGPEQPNFNQLTTGKPLFSPNVFLRPGELRKDEKGRGGHRVIIWHLQRPTL